MAAAVGLPGGDRLWTRSGPEGSSRSSQLGCRGRAGWRRLHFCRWCTSGRRWNAPGSQL